ncbi:MAG: hypothetical protein H0X71_05290, partial [Rubrobacter sp.]|nr:hypothetical protein [Rubrobacter sp.]
RKAPEEAPPRYTNRIHRDDCAGALRHLILLSNPDPIYLGVDPEPATLHTIAKWFATRPGVTPGQPSAPARSTSQNRPRETSRSASRFRTNKRCSNALLIHSGYRFLYPTFREGFTALLPKAPSNV